MRRREFLGLVGGAAAAWPISANAQQAWPSGTITIVVPYAAGGSNDVIARMIQNGLQQRLGVNVIVENRGGGNTTIGSATVAGAPRDGTRWLINADPHMLNPSMMSTMPYDTDKELDPLLLIGTSPNVIAANASKPYRTFADVLAAGREGPDGVGIAVIGGTLAHVFTLLLGKMGNAKLTPIPYRGGAPALNDVIGGHVGLIAGSVAVLTPQIASGALRPIVQTGTQRHRSLPDVPTVAESGSKDFSAESMWGFFAPTGTPQPILDRFGAALAAEFRQPEIADKVSNTLLIDLKLDGPERFRPFIQQQIEVWGRVVRENGLKDTG
jgi:tripartite-type tricarboxylate transporter receptor subunit TctC